MKALVHITFLNGEAVGPFLDDTNNYRFGHYYCFNKTPHPLSLPEIKEICIKPVHDVSEVPAQDAPMQHQKPKCWNQPAIITQ